jgi:hypothetical protein
MNYKPGSKEVLSDLTEMNTKFGTGSLTWYLDIDSTDFNHYILLATTFTIVLL